jgi:hypothetical protein
LTTKVVASREKVSSGSAIRPFSVQAPVIGFAAVHCRTYGRIRQMSFASPAAK